MKIPKIVNIAGHNIKIVWLTGWKDIAAYMGRSIQTCKNLKKHNSLPIMYPPGGTPTALRYELDKWLIEFHNIKTAQKG